MFNVVFKIEYCWLYVGFFVLWSILRFFILEVLLKGDIKVLYMYINVYDDNFIKYNVRNLVFGLYLWMINYSLIKKCVFKVYYIYFFCIWNRDLYIVILVSIEKVDWKINI